ncbi:MAG: zinc-dependent alcohol dehydrogenase family protein [Streptosporangiaceae bacterium]
MRGAIMYAPGDVRVEQRPDPTIIEPTDAIIRLSATCVCGSDLWPWRGIDFADQPTPMGHEYVGVVQETGSEVATIEPGQFVIGSFMASDNTCPICQAGYQSRCAHVEYVGAGGAQAEYLRVPLADGTLVATSDIPSDDLVPDLLAASDVLGTGWFGAVAANVQPGNTVAVVGDGAVGLLAILAARQLGAERIIAMSRHEPRQQLARQFGATDIVTERGDEGVARIKDLTDGYGAHSVIEAVGTQESMMQAIRSTRPGGHVGYVGVSHGVQLPGQELFYAEVHLLGGPAPVRRFLPELIRLIENRQINPGKVFDLTLPLDKAAEGYQAMDERRAIKALLRPEQRNETRLSHNELRAAERRSCPGRCGRRSCRPELAAWRRAWSRRGRS